MARKVPTPTFNNTGAPTAPSTSYAAKVRTSIQSGDYSSLAPSTTADPLRQYLIFELVNIGQRYEASVPQNSPTFPFMIMHMNPNSFEENYTKLVTRQITRGGYLEQHWGEELDGITCQGSTGAFVSVSSGLSFLNRKASIAYRKYLDLVALYRNNGHVYDGRGNIIFHGGVRLHFDSNIFYGYFETLSVMETAENPYTFEVSFVFKVQNSYRSMGA